MDAQRVWCISIHAPAWGATLSSICETSISSVFQSTLPHGERLFKHEYCSNVSRFQSTLPHGERRPDTRHRPRHDSISIHAPAWGATGELVCRDCLVEFQSTLPHGERPSELVWYPASLVFQSTLPHGERHGRPESLGAGWCLFQSTLPHGERLVANLTQSAHVFVFQSTLPHGERPDSRRS